MAEKAPVPVRQRARALAYLPPFDSLEEFRETMDRLWSEALATWPLRRMVPLPTAWIPRIDMFKKDGNLIVRAELPGVRPEDVEVVLEEGDLVIRGERKPERDVKEEDYYRMERSYGSFHRRLPLPFEVKAEQIQATFADGVLEICIPKPVERKPPTEQIPIKAK